MMLAITYVDVFLLMNGLLQRYPKDKQPKIYYGLSSYFATSKQKEHALVLDAKVVFRGVTPTPLNPILVNEGIDWKIIDDYLEIPARKLPIYKMHRVNIIDDMLSKASENDKHSLSAMLSNFTPVARPAVKQKVIEFLTDPKSKNFSLPVELRPQRGRAVAYYEEATKADFSELKADLLKERPETFQGRYWKGVIFGKVKKLN